MANTLRHPINLSACIIATVACFICVFQSSHAGTHEVSMVPASVVSLNLTRTLAELEETKIVRANLKKMDDAISTHKDKANTDIESMRDQLETMDPAGAEFKGLQEDMLMRAAGVNAWVNAKQELRAIEESLEYIRMYKKILQAAQELAEASGYDFILLDDTDIELQVAAPRDTIAQLFSRRIIYGNPSRDITTDLVERMNNESRLPDSP